MTVATLHRWSMFGCCALAALGTVSGSTRLAVAGGLLIATMMVTSGQLHDQTRSSARTWIVHGVTVAVLVWALSVARSARIDSVVIVVLLGLFNRFMLRQGLRDDLILLGGAAVLVAVSTTITPGLAFLPIFIGFVALSMSALRTAQILGMAEREASPRAEFLRRSLMARPAPGGHGSLVAIALVFIFIGYLGLTLFPKHRFARFLGAGAFMSLPGAGDSMTLTNNGVGAREDGTVVLRVSRRPGSESLLSGLYAKLYSLDIYDGLQWRRERKGAWYPLVKGPLRAPNPDSRSQVDVVLHRIRRVRGLHPLVTLGRQWPARLLDLEHRGRISVDGTWGVSMPRTSLTLTYGVDLGERAPRVELPNAAQRKVQQRWLRLPESLDPRIQTLGRRLTASATTSADKINAVLAHFGDSYTYSLEPIPGENADPLARFMFEARRGHCELYAGAVAVLLRVAGVPARVVTGYYGGWWNSTGQALEFTEQDAHAWVEAYDPDRGWIWVDATPPSLRARRRGKVLGWIRDLYDTLEALWFNNVIDFDEKKRRDLLNSVFPKSWFEEGRGRVGALFGDNSGTAQIPRNAGWILAVVILAGIVVAIVVFRMRRRDPHSLGRVLRRALDPQADPSTPLQQLVGRVPEAQRAQAIAVVNDYQTWRFGRSETRVPPPELAKAVGQLRKALSRAPRRLRH